MSDVGGVPPIREAGFSAEVSLAEPLTLTLRGNADISTATSLTSMVQRIHGIAIERALPAVLVDMAQLEFMNASSFNVFVDWLALIYEAVPEQRYVLRFRSNKKLPWQARSLHTLSCFASHLIEVEG